jgi:predicted nucleic acid-binding protein
MTTAMARLVADADVLAADLLRDGPAREALDLVRAHDWITLVAGDALLDDAEAVIGTVADEALAADWRPAIATLVESVDHPAGDHPALASAYQGDARHVLTFDETLRSAAAGAAIRDRLETSVKHPAAFVQLFDPATMYDTVVGGSYPGRDREPRLS